MIEKEQSKIDFISLEKEVLERWKEEDTFNKLREKNKDGKRFSFLDGPITANNPMGVHHAWGRTYKDIFQRYKAMQGYDQRYQNGFDCQGLWVEVEVEKDLGFKSKRDIESYGVDKFVEKCKERVRKYSAVQTEQSIRLGQWMDWDNSYYTYSDENNYTIWSFLKKCHERGLIYKGDDVMPWCPRCGTSLSEHEIATEGYVEIKHPSVFVLFPLLERDNEFLLIWTTTPWTLAANVSAAVKSDIKYVKAEFEGKVIYMAESRHKEIKAENKVLGRLTGKEMIGWSYSAPFGELPVQENVEHKVIEWDDVSEDEGTGIVHIAPGCGREDYGLSKKYDLTVIKTLDEEGSYIDGFGELTGKNVSEVNDWIFNNLKGKGLLFKKETISHRYPVCWRCKTELVFRLVDEWFISMDELRGDIMDITRKINWMPSFGLERELDWLSNMQDWNISKKRYWGLALPIYECDACGHLDVMGSREELQKRAVSGWEAFEGHTPHKPWIDEVKIACSECGEQVSRIPEVGNPWLDAGIVPYSTMGYNTDRSHWENWFPADFITESFPGQFRNWFYSLLAMSAVMENSVPFKNVLGHALVKDEKGDDMHKSAGNAIPFEEAADTMGVDVLRWIFASQNPYNNLLFGYGLADENRRKILTLWNVYTFFTTYASIDKYDPNKRTPAKERTELDRWLIAKTNLLVKYATKELDGYQTVGVMRRVEKYLNDLSNWYVRRSRRRFWRSSNDTDKMHAYDTLYEALVTLIKILAPILPFLTEKIYSNLVRDKLHGAPDSVHLSSWPQLNEELIDEKLINAVDTVIKAVEAGRAARNKAQIKVRQPLKEIHFFTDVAEEKEVLLKLSDQILEELNIKKLNVIDNMDELSVLKAVPNFKKLGPAFGKNAQKVGELLKSTDVEQLNIALSKSDIFSITSGAEKFEITREMVSFEHEQVDGMVIVENNEMRAALDTTLTPELVRQGLVRELVHDINNLRKEAEFDVSDRINMYLSLDGNLLDAVKENESYLANEVLAEKIGYEFEEGEYSQDIRIGEETVRVGIERVSNGNQH